MKLNEQEKKEIDLYLKKYDFAQLLKDKNVLITGYKGLIGTGLTKWLLRANELLSTNTKIYLSSRKPNSFPDWIEKEDDVAFTAFMSEGDLDTKFDLIIHLAAPTDKKYFVSNPIDSIDSIYEGTKYYLNLAAKQPHCKFLFVSSVEAYGCPHGDILIDESYIGEISSLNIRNGYPLGKRAAEYLCYVFWKERNLETYILRPSSVQGLFQKYDETRIFNEILRCLIEKRDFVMKTDGLTKKSIVYSLDVVSAILCIFQKGEAGEAYNVTNSSIYLSMNEYVETIFSHFKCNSKLIHEAANASNEGFLPKVEYNLSTKKLESLGWTPLADLFHIYSIDYERFNGK